MAFEALEAHLKRLGIAPLGDALEPIAADVWLPIEAAAEGLFPPVVRWLLERFGGFQFAEGALYDTPTDRGLLFGAFLSGAEIATAFDDTRDSMPDSFVPLVEDGGGNYLCVDLTSGAIAFWVTTRHAIATSSRSPRRRRRSSNRSTRSNDSNGPVLAASRGRGRDVRSSLARANRGEGRT